MNVNKKPQRTNFGEYDDFGLGIVTQGTEGGGGNVSPVKAETPAPAAQEAKVKYVTAPGIPPNTKATVVTNAAGQFVITPVDKSIKPVTITPGVTGPVPVAVTPVQTKPLNWWDQMWLDVERYLGLVK